MTTTEQNQAQGALVGLKVLDFGQYIPGPMSVSYTHLTLPTTPYV